MLKKLVQTEDDAAIAIVRIMLGVVFFGHGAQKMLGWFGGHGFSGTMQGMSQMGLPAAVVLLVILAEFFGSLGLIFGFLGRVAALGIVGVMLGALFLVHLQHGFYMNWYGSQKGEGFEYHLLALAMALAVMVRGSGRWSVDRSFSDKALYARG
jgi:putative oxidoreductase